MPSSAETVLHPLPGITGNSHERLHSFSKNDPGLWTRFLGLDVSQLPFIPMEAVTTPARASDGLSLGI